MITRIDLVVGAVRAAELINDYRERLQREDLLSDEAALAIACTSFSSGNVYTMTVAGQVWRRIGDDGELPREVVVLGTELHCTTGWVARCRDMVGIEVNMNFTVLDAEYDLVRWPISE
ncbi:hypothetical protein AB0D66_32485 [Streptomyces sp. NPDC048270]|uniref:hypothetical protein n=1 Tax=Streptomyces sp. NPDC048270 TaxID=3154615 RepID=UPI0033C17936